MLITDALHWRYATKRMNGAKVPKDKNLHRISISAKPNRQQRFTTIGQYIGCIATTNANRLQTAINGLCVANLCAAQKMRNVSVFGRVSHGVEP